MQETLIIEIADGGICQMLSTHPNLKIIIIDKDLDFSTESSYVADIIHPQDVQAEISQLLEETE